MITTDMWRQIDKRKFDGPSTRSGYGRLSNEAVRRIRKCIAEGVSVTLLAQRFQTETSTIHGVATGRLYREVA